MNLLDFLPAGSMKRVASSSGGEWAGPCPWCGGRDRFRVWPEHPSGDAGGRFLCRGCGRHGDGIAFLRERDGLSYVDACKALHVSPKALGRGHRSQVIPAWTPAVRGLPPVKWREAAEAFAFECAARMVPDFEGRSAEGVAYAASRHLAPETVATLRIGWNPVDAWQDREAWGLPPELNANGKPRTVWMPAGLVLPTRRKSGLVAVKVRRVAWTPEDRLPKYVALSGSVPGLALRHGANLPVVVVESELDAMLIWQEARDLVSAFALGSAAARPDADVATFLRAAPRIFVATDFDRAGQAAVPWWREHFPQAEPWPVPQGKDVGDLAATPGLVRAWIEAALPEPANPEELELPPGLVRCANCGRPFPPSSPTVVYCGAECFNHAQGGRQ